MVVLACMLVPERIAEFRHKDASRARRRPRRDDGPQAGLGRVLINSAPGSGAPDVTLAPDSGATADVVGGRLWPNSDSRRLGAPIVLIVRSWKGQRSRIDVAGPCSSTGSSDACVENRSPYS